MTNTLVEERYAKIVDESNLGCANVSGFIVLLGGEKVLDLGCGNGSQVHRFARLVGKEGMACGLDTTEKMIERAKANYFLPNTDYLVGDIHSLPYEPGFFDVITSNCVINHSLNKRRVFEEIYRVIKQGGFFVIGDVMAVNKLPDSVVNNPQNIADCWGGAIPKKDYLDIVSEVGFTSIEVLSSRKYIKNGYGLESIILKGVKK